MVSTVAGIHLGIDTHANRPAGNTVPDSSFYSCSTHGLIYKSNYAGNSWATWATLGGSSVTDATISVSDVTTNNASTAAHGWLKKLSNVSTEYMSGTGVWSTPAGGGSAGALVLIEQHTASASATLDFTAFISSTYDEYLFELINVVPATDNVGMFILAGTGGGPTYDTGSNYTWAGFRWAHNGSAAAGSTSTTSIGIDASGGIDNGTSSGVCGHIRLFDPQSGVFKRVVIEVGYTDNQPVNVGAIVNGRYHSATALTAIRFLMGSGNIASGVIRVYGVAKT